MYCVPDIVLQSHLYAIIIDKILFSLKYLQLFLCLTVNAICNLVSQPQFIVPKKIFLTFFLCSRLFKIYSVFKVWFHFCLFLEALLDLFNTVCDKCPSIADNKGFLWAGSLLSCHILSSAILTGAGVHCYLAFHMNTSYFPNRFCVLLVE